MFSCFLHKQHGLLFQISLLMPPNIFLHELPPLIWLIYVLKNSWISLWIIRLLVLNYSVQEFLFIRTRTLEIGLLRCWMTIILFSGLLIYICLCLIQLKLLIHEFPLLDFKFQSRLLSFRWFNCNSIHLYAFSILWNLLKKRIRLRFLWWPLLPVLFGPFLFGIVKYAFDMLMGFIL